MLFLKLFLFVCLFGCAKKPTHRIECEHILNCYMNANSICEERKVVEEGDDFIKFRCKD